ncbi:YjaG family protein [Conservatibacter flavescens]|uniref:DUF416 domain-containing protein n=1 Tax=Conservatibacter flavescens TaxID=28161 RepID=A0A2M8S2J3_9PAST|nr:DUF416 family protein [Conservatibacter flavescens]PJG85363.1 DUF416 domain-containing protein [Conservatibacter flavescens]
MRNPIHKRLEKFESWQSLGFMASLCERMLPNFRLFCQMTEQLELANTYQNILNLVWEYLTVKGAKINFDNQLEKLETIIPDVNNYDFYGVVPALDACESLSELLHALIAGEYIERSIKISLNSLHTVIGYLETQQDKELSEAELKGTDEIQQELDVQWAIYRALNECDERDTELLISLKNTLRNEGVSNIGVEIMPEM